MAFKAIGFDYSGVITHRSNRNFLGDISGIIATPLGELRKIYFEHNKLVNVDGVPYEQFWKIILEKLAKKDKYPEVLKYITGQESPTINENMVGLVDRLRSLGYKVGLLSNNSRGNGDKMRQIGLNKHFDTVIISAEVGYQKPSPEIFNLFIEKLRISPSELIFIDDSEQSLRLSQDIGFYPILFKNYDNLITELMALGVLGA